ncbi:MAG: sensor histidine kinase [Chloroflexi bacterium]|nr:sensor histidine kinase [Chloroflexota bacterium]
MDDQSARRWRPLAWPGPRRWRLATRLTVAMLALLLLLQGLGLIAASWQAQERRAAEQAQGVALAETLASFVGGYAADLEHLTLAAALALGAADQPLDQATVGPYLQALATASPVLRGLFIADLGGRVIATTTTNDGVDLNERPYMRSLRGGAPTAWSRGQLDPQTGAVTAAFGRVIYDARGAPRAYLIASFYPARLLDRLPAGLPADGAVTLIDADGVVLHATDRPDLPAAEQDVAGAPGVAAALAGAVVPVTAAATPFAGEARFGALAPVPEPGWVVAFTRPQAALEALLRRQLLVQAGALALALLGTAAVVAVLTSRLTWPLAQLARTAAAIARGERPAVPAAATADPDVAELADAMASMSAAVAAREDRLRLLSGAGAAMIAPLDADARVQVAAQAVVPVLADWCIAYLAEADGAVKRVAIAHADPAVAEQARAALAATPAVLAPGDPVAEVLRTGQTIVIDDLAPAVVERALRDEAHRALLHSLGVRAQLVAPLVARGQVLGALSLLTAGSDQRFGPAETALAEEMARRIALAVDNARLYSEALAALHRRDEFLSVAAHELKTPVAGLKGSAQLLQRAEASGRLESERLQRGLARIVEASDRLTALTDDLLDSTRIRLGQLALRAEPLDLAALTRTIVERTQAGLDSRHRLELTLPDEPVQIVGDASRLEQVLDNLLDNAIKYSPGGGLVRVGLCPVADGVLLTVADEGIGLPDGLAQDIFEPFGRADNARRDHVQGLGLGLHICRSIVERHGGRITAESEGEGRGTTFRVWLPMTPPDGSA